MRLRSVIRPLILSLLSAIILFIYLAQINGNSRIPVNSDFAKFYASVRFAIEGENIYSPVSVDAFGDVPDRLRERINLEVLHPNLNLPAQTWLFLPFGLLDYQSAYWVWSILSIISGFLSVAVIDQIIRRSSGGRSRLDILVTLLFFYFPTFAAVLLGQLSLVLLFLLVLAWRSVRAGKDSQAGIILGLALCLKLFTGLFLLVFLLQRRWKLAFWYAATFVLINFLTLLAFGTDSYREYLSVIQKVTWHSASWNPSFMGFFTRIFGGSENEALVNLPFLAYSLSCLLSFVWLLLLAWAARPGTHPVSKPETRMACQDLLFSLTIVAMLLLSPLSWMYSFVLLLIPAVVAWQISASVGGKRYRFSIVVAWLLSTIPHLLILPEEVNAAVMFLWAGVYFYSLVIFSGICLALIYQLKKRSGAIQIQETQDIGQMAALEHSSGSR